MPIPGEPKVETEAAARQNVRLARNLRNRATDAERALWRQLRDRQIDGHKFRCQVVIGRYIVDFACMPEKLIVEVDGSQHMTPDVKEIARTQWLENEGYRIVRFWSNEVLRNTDGVVLRIYEALG